MTPDPVVTERDGGEVMVDPRSAIERLPTRVQKKIDTEATGDCWVWIGHRHRQGYGVTSRGKQTILAHRFVWQELVGEIPQGTELHHVCENEPCCNPAHLQAVSAVEHHRLNPNSLARKNAMKTHCPQGHEYNDTDTLALIPKRYPDRAYRVCGICYPYRFKSLKTWGEWKANAEVDRVSA